MAPTEANGRISRISDLMGKLEDFFECCACQKKDLTGSPVLPFPERKLSAVAGALALPLSQAARLLLISSLLQSRGDELNCRFNELASVSGLSERTAYRALKEIKESGLFEIKAIPGTGVTISSGWLWNEPCDKALRILGNNRS
ncbi:MAG TPA: HTH domain-containing protein [Synergistetes bacterium]|nr:HTH domain-containing protein [Synergistota bacterium]